MQFTRFDQTLDPATRGFVQLRSVAAAAFSKNLRRASLIRSEDRIPKIKHFPAKKADDANTDDEAMAVAPTQ